MTFKKSGEIAVNAVHAIPASSGLTVQQILDVLKSEKDIQVFDADEITGPDQIKLAFFHADMSSKEDKNLVRDRMLEVLLRAAGSRQVADAVKRVGVKDPKRIIIGFKGDAKRKAQLLKKLDAKEMKWKHIDKEMERKAIERMVLLQIE
jgi:tRNA threonylcarbamoyladenosine modification (KEOPS) complex Cgi121 subunit